MASNLITLTSLSTSIAFDLSVSKLIQVVEINSAANSQIVYVDNFENTLKEVKVVETASSINSSAGNLFPVTLLDGSSIWLNVEFVCSVSATGTGATVKYDSKRVGFAQYVVTETPAQIQTLINALTILPVLTGAIFTDPITYSLAATLTAHAGGGQASATAITEELNIVTICATAGDSVKLPSAVAGFKIIVKNEGATALDIFPFSGDSIDALAVNLAVRIQPGTVVSFIAATSVVWQSDIDRSFTLDSPTTLKGQLTILAADSAGNTVTTITNASQAAARVYTIPDAGADASFVMTAGAQNIAGVKNLATDLTFAKEVNHTVNVVTSTTATVVGGSLSLVGGIGATTGNGGAVNINGGVGGATAGTVGGSVAVTSGISGAGNGASGAVNLKSGGATAANTGAISVASGVPATSGNSGAVSIATGVAVTGNSGAVTVLSGATTTGDSGGITVSTGNAGTGASGDITLSPGTASTVVGKVITSNALIQKHKTAAINSTATATATQAATGYITSTSAAGTTITLPTGTLLGAELGAGQGTIHELFIDNTAGANTVTIAVAVNGILSASAVANAASLGLLTVPSGVTGQGRFTLMFSSATAYTFSRTA